MRRIIGLKRTANGKYRRWINQEVEKFSDAEIHQNATTDTVWSCRADITERNDEEDVGMEDTAEQALRKT